MVDHLCNAVDAIEHRYIMYTDANIENAVNLGGNLVLVDISDFN